MLKFLWVEDPEKGVFSLKFIGSCHIDANVRFIFTESSPYFSSTLAEGNGRTTIFSQKKMGLAKQVANHLNWENSFIGRLRVFPKRTFHRHEVFPQSGDEAELVPCPVRPIPFETFVGRRHGCIENRSLSMNETHGLNC
jgi:hypothetical protein